MFNQSLYDELMHNWTRPGGCKEQYAGCRDAVRSQGTFILSQLEKNLTEICEAIEDSCANIGVESYVHAENARGWYDIGHPLYDPFPPPTMQGYLTEESVLAALGVPVNYSSTSPAVSAMFTKTYDILLGGFLDSIAYLLDSGIKVHMMYGDRDYACNWLGGEKASLAVPYSRAAEFANTGYSPLLTPAGLSGWTRQLGNYSFSRVYQSGHEVPSYQPEAAYEIFMRATFNRDIATGLIPVTDDLLTVGPKDTWAFKNVPPEMPAPRCHILTPGSCLPEVWEKVLGGRVVVKDWFVVEELPDDEILVTSMESQGTIDEP